MNIVGRRRDGALHVSILRGQSVILRGNRVSPAVDSAVADTMGPWAAPDNSLEARRAAERQLAQAKVVPVTVINMAMSFDEQRDRVMVALRARLGVPQTNGPYPCGDYDLYIPQNGLGDDWVVYCRSGKHWGMTYGLGADGAVQFDGDPVEVVAAWETIGDGDAETIESYMASAEHADLKASGWYRNFMSRKRAAKSA